MEFKVGDKVNVNKYAETTLLTSASKLKDITFTILKIHDDGDTVTLSEGASLSETDNCDWSMEWLTKVPNIRLLRSWRVK